MGDVAKYVDAAKVTQLLAYRHSQTWGGVTAKENRLYFCVDQLPADRKLTVPDLTTRMTKRLDAGGRREKTADHHHGG